VELWPMCQKCGKAPMLPLSDYGQEGAAVIFKAWACSSPACSNVLRVDKGNVSWDRATAATSGRAA